MGYQHHLNISEQWRFKCILYPHALFSSFPINCIDLLRVRGYTFVDQENSLIQQNCLLTQDRSIPPLFPFRYIMVIHSASPKLHNTYISSRKEMDKELSIFMGKKVIDFPSPSNLVDIVISDQVLASFSSSLKNSVHFQNCTRHEQRNFQKY